MLVWKDRATGVMESHAVSLVMCDRNDLHSNQNQQESELKLKKKKFSTKKESLTKDKLNEWRRKSVNLKSRQNSKQSKS